MPKRKAVDEPGGDDGNTPPADTDARNRQCVRDLGDMHVEVGSGGDDIQTIATLRAELESANKRADSETLHTHRSRSLTVDDGHTYRSRMLTVVKQEVKQ